MNTGTSSAYKGEPMPSKTLFSDVINRFCVANSTQRELLDLIENRLHEIINMCSMKEDGSEALSKVESLNDFRDQCDSQLGQLEYQNQRLQSILRHLEQIV